MSWNKSDKTVVSGSRPKQSCCFANLKGGLHGARKILQEDPRRQNNFLGLHAEISVHMVHTWRRIENELKTHR